MTDKSTFQVMLAAYESRILSDLDRLRLDDQMTIDYSNSKSLVTSLIKVQHSLVNTYSKAVLEVVAMAIDGRLESEQ